MTELPRLVECIEECSALHDVLPAGVLAARLRCSASTETIIVSLNSWQVHTTSFSDCMEMRSRISKRGTCWS